MKGARFLALVFALALPLALVGPVHGADDDSDGILNFADNCTLEANPTQLNADVDSYGNACDCDYDDNGTCGFPDFTVFLGCFGQGVPGSGPADDLTCAESDQDGNLTVGFDDFNLFLDGFGGSPGPTGGPCPIVNFTTGTPGGSCGFIKDAFGTLLKPYGQRGLCNPLGQCAQGKVLEPCVTHADCDLDVCTGGGADCLSCGSLYIGGRASAQAPSATPDGATNIIGVTSCSDPENIVLGPSNGSGIKDCTHTGCFFGPPLPILNELTVAVSTCVINQIAGECDTGPKIGTLCVADKGCGACMGGPAVGGPCEIDGNCPTSTCNAGTCDLTVELVGGSLNALTGEMTVSMPLVSDVFLTGVSYDLPGTPQIEVCPVCDTGTGLPGSGTCSGGPNLGLPCSTTTSLLTTADCPPDDFKITGSLGVDLSPLGTGVAEKQDPDGWFCPGQVSAGAFGTNPDIATLIRVTGSAGGDLTGGADLTTTLGSVFCIPATASPLINAIANLPGPGATSLAGTAHFEDAPPLGSRTFSMNAPGFFSSLVDPNLSWGNWVGSFTLEAGASDEDGIAQISTPPGPFYMHLDFLGARACRQITSCSGIIDCTGGTNVDVTVELDSLAPGELDPCEGTPEGSGNSPVVSTGVNPTDSGAGAALITCMIAMVNTTSGTDCSTLAYGPPSPEVLTTGTNTATVLNMCLHPSGPATITKTGENFICSMWEIEDGPGAFTRTENAEGATPENPGDFSGADIYND